MQLKKVKKKARKSVSKERRQELVKQKIAELSRLEAELLAARQNLTALCMGTIQASQAIDTFKRTHRRMLPNSYVEATFQLALDVTLKDGSNVYCL